jgi:hypothetical protein
MVLMPTMCWGVTNDYGVVAIFETEGDAEAFRAAGGGDEVAEFPFHLAGAGERLVVVYRVYWRSQLFVTDRVYVDDENGTLARRYARPVTDRWDEPWMPRPIEAHCTSEEAAKRSVIDRQTALEARRL